MLKEFKDFALKGNLIDIAIGLVMATAFGAVTSAFVDGTFMPLVGKIFHIGNMDNMKIILDPATLDAAGKEVPEVAIKYGTFIGSIINFLIISLVMYFVIKAMNTLKDPTPDPGPAAPTQEDLLTEIRDLLKK